MKRFLFLINIIVFASIFCLQAQWQLVNGLGKSKIYAISHDANNWYAILMNGLFKSTNNGNDWEYFNNMGDLDILTEKCILNIEDTIYVGSKEGVYYSTDAGKSWELITDGLIQNKYNSGYYMIAFGSNTKNIFALTSDKLYTFDKVKKKFSLVESPIRGQQILNVAEKYLLIGSRSQTYLPMREPNIFISKDNGKTWESITDSVSGIDELDINCFALSNDTIYAGTNNGIYVSYDEGSHWELLKQGLFGYEITNLLITQEGAYAGTENGMFYASSIGNIWEKKEQGLTNNNILCMSNINGKILAGTYHGLFYTTDKGNNWVSINHGLGGGSIANINKNSNKIYAYLYDAGIFSSIDSGQTWSLIVDGSKLILWGVVAVDDNIIYTASDRIWKMLYSLDKGKTWNIVPDSTAISGRSILNLSIKNHKVIACTNKGIFISKDSAKSWYSVSPDLEPYAFNFIFFDNNYIYAGSTGNKSDGLFKSTNKGNDWEHDSTDFGADNVLTDILKTEKGIFIASYGGGVFKSTDNGMTWDSVNNGLSNKSVMSMVEYNNDIFVSTKKGIFLSTNNGDEWKEVSEGLTTRYIRKLLIIGDNIFAGSSVGLFKAKLNDFGITNVINNQIEKRNYLYSYSPYPMPAQNVVNTLIYWDTSIDIDNDKIDIIDIFGNKICDRKEITINKQTAYSGILTWNCSGVPNGIYFILLNHGTEKRAVKVMVRK